MHPGPPDSLGVTPGGGHLGKDFPVVRGSHRAFYGCTDSVVRWVCYLVGEGWVRCRYDTPWTRSVSGRVPSPPSTTLGGPDGPKSSLHRPMSLSSTRSVYPAGTRVGKREGAE